MDLEAVLQATTVADLCLPGAGPQQAPGTV